ncbi:MULTISPECIES: DUF6944 family repetitive protein [unclassified Bacillus (in: firmicutes)]|uniref:DUF6944 family repetitive protein n=1 Tax=unclassified Bacillus (in: firmicutes) TaxID=185979 RepID=UPI000D025960|nr:MULTISPECIES: hypothetical protein [unclassified Bacillus (in: firmicutes)]PRR92602.1 hypothetical protein C6W21_04150 [Bacillus sp. NMCN1]PRS00235.1 hypothetical protein C6W20_04190 [Bacillus sp. NMCN6]
MCNDDKHKILTGAWIDAFGKIISAIAEIRSLAGMNEINNKLVAIGEALQAVGSFVIAIASEEYSYAFTGNLIDGAGASTSSYAAYLQDVEGQNSDNLRLEILGDSFQSIGSSIIATGDYIIGEQLFAVGNSIQALGAGLEAIGGVYELKDKEEKAQILSTLGAISQAIGSNFVAILLTDELITSNMCPYKEVWRG